MRVIFLDIDGVLNCQIFYEKNSFNHRQDTWVKQNICTERMGWLNDLCEKVGAKVVISSSWRIGRRLDELKEELKSVGATFDIIGFTPNLRGDGYLRGNEIYKYIEDNLGGSEYRDYVIIDDDSDMLLWQAKHFFQTDSYSGLTPNTCYKINRFFNV